MTNSAIDVTSIREAPSIQPWRITLVVVLTATADCLLFGQPVGISLMLFVLAIAAGILGAHHGTADIRATLIGGAMFVATVLPLAEDINVMTHRRRAAQSNP